MKVTILCPILLAIIALVSAKRGFISNFNNGTYNSTIYTDYVSVEKAGKKLILGGSSLIPPQETEIAGLPDGFEDYGFSITVMSSGLIPCQSIIRSKEMSHPLELCFKTWGTEDDPQIGQTNCRSTGGQELLSGNNFISVTNNAIYRPKINLSYYLKNGQGKREQYKVTPRPIHPGKIKKIAIPKGAERIYFNIFHPQRNSEALFKAKFSRPVILCIQTWGTTDDPKSGQIDCLT